MKYLLLSGGGLGGISTLGVLHNHKESLHEIEEICAVSVGSVIGLLISIGYTPLELKTITENMCLLSTDDWDIQNIFTKYGL